MKVRFHGGDVRLRLSEEDLSLLNHGSSVHSLTPMQEGPPFEILLAIDSSIHEVAIHATNRDVEFKFPLTENLAALLSRESISYSVKLMTEDGPLNLCLERDLGRGMHLGDSE